MHARLTATDRLRPAAVPEGWTDPRHGPPPFRRGLIPRPRLIARLADPAVRVTLLVAPAGYGKTTLLSEWAKREKRPVAWVTVQPADGDDPEHLSQAVTDAFEYAGALRGAPSVLVLDDAHLLRDRDVLALVDDLLAGVRSGSVVALASRIEPALRISRLRARGEVVDLGVADLAMSPVEASTLLDRAGFEVRGGELRALADQTEGWPVALSLAAVSLRRQERDGSRRRTLSSDDRLISEYIRDEMLADLGAGELDFLRRAALLDPLTGPLCDAALERSGSGRLLRDLARGNVLISAVDATDHEYRFHPFLSAMLAAELWRGDAQAAVAVHRRASHWLERHGDVDGAVRHALAAGDRERAASLVWRVAPDRAFGGGHELLQSWLDAFGDAEVSSRAGLSVAAAAVQLARGDRDRMEHWAAVAELCIGRGAPAPPDAAAAASLLRRGAAVDDAPATGAWRCLALLQAGARAHLTGDRDAARRLLTEGARAAAVDAPLLRALCLAQLALLAAEHADFDEAGEHVGLAHACLAGCEPAGAAALVYAASAAVHAHAGDPEDAGRDISTALALLGGGAGFAPWIGAETRIWTARASIRLGEIAAARGLLAQAARARHQVEETAVLGDWIAQAWDRADAFAAGAPGAPDTLTLAELRVLRFLPSHLCFREIGERLHVSANTVKTQALAIYRKLDVSSRSEAVARACAVGLLDA